MTDYKKLCEDLRICCGDVDVDDCGNICSQPHDVRGGELRWCRQWLIKDAADAIEELQAENERLKKQLDFSYTAHDVAKILADAIGDCCACNVNGNDEWLPFKCELRDDCPEPEGVACWEQYLKWLGEEKKV